MKRLIGVLAITAAAVVPAAVLDIGARCRFGRKAAIRFAWKAAVSRDTAWAMSEPRYADSYRLTGGGRNERGR